MPSPTEITLPTSLTSTPPRYSSICSRIILVISSALISMFLSFLDETGFERFELLANGAVVNCAPHLRDDTADQRRIDSYFHPDLLSGGLLKPGCESLLFGMIQ